MRAFASAGANIVLNGIGAPSDIERTRSAIETDFGLPVITNIGLENFLKDWEKSQAVKA